jgi:hypothetical protein
VPCLRKPFFLVMMIVPEKADFLGFHPGKQVRMLGCHSATLLLCLLVRLMIMLVVMLLISLCYGCRCISTLKLWWLNMLMVSCEPMVMILVMLPYLILLGAYLSFLISIYGCLCFFKLYIIPVYGPWTIHSEMETTCYVASRCLLWEGFWQPFRIYNFPHYMFGCLHHGLRWIFCCMLSCCRRYFLLVLCVSSLDLAYPMNAFYLELSSLEHSSLFFTKHRLFNGYT